METTSPSWIWIVYWILRVCIAYSSGGIVAMVAAKKTKKTHGSINSRLALVMKSGKFTLGYQTILESLRSSKVISVCKRFKDHVLLLEAPLRGVAPMLSALRKLQSSNVHLTTLHPDFLQLCLLSNCYKFGLTILDDDILEVDQPRDLFLNCYYGDVGQDAGEEVRAPLPVVKETLYDDAAIYYRLNRDTWANEAVGQTVSSNFIFWQHLMDPPCDTKVWSELSPLESILLLVPVDK